MRSIKSPDERKLEIIRSAKELFVANGVDKTSVSQIVKNIGVAQGLFYYYFKSKEEVIAAVVDSLLDECEKNLQELTKRPADNFYAYIREFVITFRSTYQTLCVKLGYTTLENGLKAKIHQRVIQQMIIYTKDLLMQGVKTGFVKLRYPELMHRLIITGLWELVEDGVTDTEVLLALAEQAFGLPENSLQLLQDNLEIVNI